MLLRLDAELVRRKLARSREHAQELIAQGSVKVDGVVSTKSTRQVTREVSIVVEGETEHYVSRGAYKLLGALDAFSDLGLSIANRSVLDAGASTGGFTQVALERNASRVLAVDVGYGQIAWQLRTDQRVHVLERFNIRFLTTSDLPFPIDFVVADLSFISLRTVLPAISSCISPLTDLVLMVKPQFEVGKEAVGEGVVTDPHLRMESVISVIDKAQELNLGLRAVQASPLPGPSGNVEYFVWLTQGYAAIPAQECAQLVLSAVERGPQ
jgi:23S rRNA (cytidine1920-2'-O)/16S rRNA (cytidine1409-2'-O)-methyltransferase